jgi:putative oxygen-independent coproporphyrinogen III oxidase
VTPGSGDAADGAAAPGRPRPRHVYVHVPFCARRCTYCDFAIAVRREVPAGEYIAAIAGELGTRFAGGDAWYADTLYLGGGTPSRLGADGIRRLMDVLRARITPAPDAEVTIEANPDDVTPAAIAAWRAAGVTRLSLGAQSFDPGALAWMHRTHTADQIAEAVGIARNGGIASLSLDLIFALPESVPRSWSSDLEAALALGPDHLSLYGLTVEGSTPLGRWVARGAVTAATDDRYAQDYLAAHAALSAAGFEHYEVSSFAKPGARSRHNSGYWSGAAYAGLGPGAHEFDGDVRRWNIGAYTAWAQRALRGEDPLADREILTDGNRVSERLYLELRTAAGTVLDGVADARVEQLVRPWVEAGWARLESGGARLSLTVEGWLRLDELVPMLANPGSRY